MIGSHQFDYVIIPKDKSLFTSSSRIRPTSVLPTVLLLMVLTVQVGVRLSVKKLAYERERVRTECLGLDGDIRNAKAELASAQSPSNILDAAVTELGMHQPNEGDVRIVNTSSKM